MKFNTVDPRDCPPPEKLYEDEMELWEVTARRLDQREWPPELIPPEPLLPDRGITLEPDRELPLIDYMEAHPEPLPELPPLDQLDLAGELDPLAEIERAILEVQEGPPEEDLAMLMPEHLP